MAVVENKDFMPIPEDKKPLYRFDLNKWFYIDEVARQRDFRTLQQLEGQMAALNPDVGKDPAKLLCAIELKERMAIIASRLRAYGFLRYAVDTADTVAKSEGDAAWSNFNATTQYVSLAVQSLDEGKLKDFTAREPDLARYAFLLEDWRRAGPHTCPEAAENLLARIEPVLDPFEKNFYDLMLARTPEATLLVGPREFSVMNPGDYSELMRLEDRAIRESAFHRRLAGFKTQGDIYSFALLQKIKLSNEVASARGFDDSAEAALFEYYLTPEMLDTVLTAFREKANLTIRFQVAERAYQEQLLQLGKAELWDLEARPTSVPEPRFTIGDASQSIIEATRIFGPKYRAEMEELHNPHNGRMDLVAGENRTNGDFTYGSYGPSWLFYMQGYTGYLLDVVTLAHESAHAIHFRLLYKAGVSWYYGDGARYFTEGFAKVNELLILDKLANTAKTRPERLYYLRELNSKMSSVKFASMYWAAYATSFETEVYRRAKNGAIEGANDIHEVWAEFGQLWMLDAEKFPDLKYGWAGTHHFFDASRYYSNYLFAWILAVSIYQRLQEDPGFATKVVELMEAGFSDKPAAMLRSKLGIDLTDKSALERLFVVVETRLAEFEQEIRANVA
ncbi:M3 family metallopeptidase [Mesorhizobium sp. M1348]|uniref:M3 family oligoendopeptidase n=1 Tax=unclassified Mesorhizobium TaxID=325217 RepID=UPI0033389F2C